MPFGSGSSWHTVRLELAGNGVGPYTATCIVDGTHYDMGWDNRAPTQSFGKVTVNIGAQASTTSPMEVYYDNVWIDSK